MQSNRQRAIFVLRIFCVCVHLILCKLVVIVNHKERYTSRELVNKFTNRSPLAVGVGYKSLVQSLTSFRVETDKNRGRLTYSRMPSQAPGQSREVLTMDDVYHKQKSSKGMVLLGIFAALMTVATIVLGVLYGLNVGSTPPADVTSPPPTTGNPSDTKDEICETQACVTAASRILGAMNQEINPCEDFYEFACGIWNRDHIIPDDKSSVSTFNGLRDDVSKVLKRVLEADSTGDRESIVKAKDFYASCMDTAKIDELGAQPVLDLITKMGGWPVIDATWIPPTTTFEELLGTFRSMYGTYAIMSSWVSADDKDSKANIIQLDQPSLGMPNRDYYLDNETRAKTEPGYRKYMTDMMTMLAGNDRNETRIEEVVDQILDLETALAISMAPDSERRDSFAIYRKKTLKELSDDISGINWLTYINKVLEIADEASLKVDDTENVVIYATDYLGNVTSIVDPSNNMELVQNYLVWRVLKDRTSYMSADLRATRIPYNQATSGTTAEEARWETCSDVTNSNFPMPTSALFVKEVFPEENKDATVQMVEDLREVFKEMLPGNDWMDNETKDAARAKADLINPIIAYPDYILDENNPKLDDDYQDIAVQQDAYFDGIQDLVVLDSKQSFGKLRDPVDFEEWITSPAIVNAFYSPSRNQIVFPAGILQPPFYDAGQPSSMNYGGIGMVIGHEITHGFDDSGSQFDGYGNLNNWWSNSSSKNFEGRSQCMVDQYASIAWDVAGGENINGELTLGENIADNGGVRQAYGAYKKWQENNPGGDLRLPGLGGFTQDQLFFIGHAQVWCGTYTPEYALRLLKTDSHSPNLYRVLIPDKNFPEFGEAYNCQKNEDPMYPPEVDTCRVW